MKTFKKFAIWFIIFSVLWVVIAGIIEFSNNLSLNNILILYLIVHQLLFWYIYGFQRVTLSLSRQQTEYYTEVYQETLTPRWVGIGKFITGLLWFVNIISVIYFLGPLGLVFYVIITPILLLFFHLIVQRFRFTFKYYFKIIEAHLKNLIENQPLTIEKRALEKIYKEVIDSRKRHKI